jgi:TusA-related sulfurtransferase
MKSGDELVVTCDHPSAATSSIPQFANNAGFSVESKKISPGLWELRLAKK